MKRRTFIKDLVVSAMALAAFEPSRGEARPANRAVSVRYLRPPGALPEDEFVSRCIRCGQCSEVCPNRCIKFFGFENGTASLDTPYIIPREKACILCSKCMEVCPTEALTETPLREIDMGIAQIDRAACYPWVDRGICGACVSICPLGDRAIGFELWNQYRPIVKQGCVGWGCGLCVEVCPEPSLPIWVVRRSEGTVAKHRV